MALTRLELVASFLGLFAMIGVSGRLGALGAVGVIGLAIIGLGAAASIVAWALPLWKALQGIGYAIVGSAVLRRGIGPPRSTVLVSFGFLIGSTVFLLLSFAEVGWRDPTTTIRSAWVIGGVVGIVLISSGLVGLGTVYAASSCLQPARRARTT